MENFVTVISQLIYIGGSSYVLSSCAAGKASVIPYKQCSKAFSGRKRKHLKTTVNVIEVEVEPLTYYKPEFKPKQKPFLLH